MRGKTSFGNDCPKQDPDSPEVIRPLGDRDSGEGDRRDGDAHGRDRLWSGAAADGEECVLRDPLAVQGQGLARALRDPHSQTTDRYPSADTEDGRLAPASRPPSG